MRVHIAKLLFTLVALIFTTIVCKAAAADYEEVGYEDLVQQINAKKHSIQTRREPQPFDTLMLHAGVGYVNSFSEMTLNNRSAQRYQNGLQLSLGVDLFSENWFGEMSFRNFGITTYGSEEITLKELDLKLGYKMRIQKPIYFRTAFGLANRYLHITDSVQNVGADDTTPMLMGSAGIFAEVSPMISLGIDLSGKSSLINRTADQSAYDITFDVRASL